MKLFIVILLSLGAVSLSAQNLSDQDRTDITSRLDEYFDYTKVNDFSNMMDYVYPKVFTLATKEQMVAVFEGLETMGIGLNVDEIGLTTLAPLTEEGEKRFAVINYSIKVRLELLTPNMQSDQVIESLKSSFKVSYNATNMAYNEETKELSFDGSKYVLAVKDPEYDSDNWYFLEYDESNPMAAQMMLSSEVLSKFKEKMK